MDDLQHTKIEVHTDCRFPRLAIPRGVVANDKRIEKYLYRSLERNSVMLACVRLFLFRIPAKQHAVKLKFDFHEQSIDNILQTSIHLLIESIVLYNETAKKSPL